MVNKTVGRKASKVCFEDQNLLYQKGDCHLRVAFDNKLKLYTIHYNSKKLTKSTFPKLRLPKLSSRKLNEIANIFYLIRGELEKVTHTRLKKKDIKQTFLHYKEAKLIDIFSEEAKDFIKKHFSLGREEYSQEFIQVDIDFWLELLEKERGNVKAGKPLENHWYFSWEVEDCPEENSLFVFYDKKENIPQRLKQVNKWRAEENKGSNLNKSTHLYTFDNRNIKGVYESGNEITNEWIIEQFLILLKEDKHAVAAISGIEQFARLDKIEPKNKITLKKVGDLYFERKIKPLKEKNKEDAKNWWAQFVKTVKRVYISDITLEDMNHYQTKMHGLREKGGLSPTWVKHRLDMVKTILKNCLKYTEDTSDIRTVLDWCQHFHYPDKKVADPKPISKEHFQELLKHCQDKQNVKWEAILLLSLNGGLYLKDIKDLKWEHLDLANKTLIMRRVKTGILRVCFLWNRTIDVIERYKKTIKHSCDSVFVGRTGLPYKTQSSRDCFNKRIKEKTSVPKEVKFNHIRDGAITAAMRSKNPEQHVKLFSGHSCGITDKYAMRDPFIVKDVCEAIEQHYFYTDNEK